ncbi:hypothetical protein BH10CHL1_BH10CHL1_29570 [soil metagenome]
MDCLQQLTLEGGSTGRILVCRSQLVVNRVTTWVIANPMWAVSLFLGTLVLVVLLGQIGHSVFTRQQARSAAKKRAELLLRNSITSEQYNQLVNCGYLEIPSRLYPGYLYRIPRTQQRVAIYETSQSPLAPYSRKLAELCVLACEQVPDADMVLAHKLMIEADEHTYLSIANRIG